MDIPDLLGTSWPSPPIFLLNPFDGAELKSFCSASKNGASLRQMTQTRGAVQLSRLAEFGGRGMSFNIYRSTQGCAILPGAQQWSMTYAWMVAA